MYWNYFRSITFHNFINVSIKRFVFSLRILFAYIYFIHYLNVIFIQYSRSYRSLITPLSSSLLIIIIILWSRHWCIIRTLSISNQLNIVVVRICIVFVPHQSSSDCFISIILWSRHCRYCTLFITLLSYHSLIVIVRIRFVCRYVSYRLLNTTLSLSLPIIIIVRILYVFRSISSFDHAIACII